MIAKWLPAHVTLVVCVVSVLAIGVSAYPVYAAIAHHQNVLTGAFGQGVGHAISAVSTAIGMLGTVVSAAGHSIVPLLRGASPVISKEAAVPPAPLPAPPVPVTESLLPLPAAVVAAPPELKGVSPVADTIFGDIEIANLILTDVVSFSQGNAVSGTVTIENKVYSTSVILLPNGPAAPYVTLSNGSIWSILMLVLTDAAAFAAGSPLMVAVKVGNTWSGLTLTSKPV